jgi:hypothetical protein
MWETADFLSSGLEEKLAPIPTRSSPTAWQAIVQNHRDVSFTGEVLNVCFDRSGELTEIKIRVTPDVRDRILRSKGKVIKSVSIISPADPAEDVYKAPPSIFEWKIDMEEPIVMTIFRVGNK